MALRKATPLTIRPSGVSDALDGTNSPPGAMSQLANLVPHRGSQNAFVPRPAAVQLTAFAGFNTPAAVSACLVIGSKVYGMIGTARNGGKDEPFVYDLAAGSFIAVSGVTNGNTPATQSTSGDWTPPTMAMIANRVIVTHPGFPGGATKFGWFDVSSFLSNTLTGTSHVGTNVFDAISANVLLAGWQVGMAFQNANNDYPAGTVITSIAVGGLSITLSNVAGAGHVGSVATVQGGTPAAPLWGAGDTQPNNLAAVPIAVAQFNGRAYFAVNNAVTFSDSLIPCQVTNATQTLVLGDNVAVNALAPLGLANQVVGGIIQALVAFKGAHLVYQITGDSATNDLKQNASNVATGTLAPMSVVVTPKGTAFVSPDGLRFIDMQFNVSEPIGAYGDGVALPFQFAVNPSRMVAAYNDDTYRISVINGNVQGNPVQDWWFNFALGKWTGPHTFAPATVNDCNYGNGGFILSVPGINGALWQGLVYPTLTSTYTENGNPISWAYQTVLLPDTEEMDMVAVQETTIAMQIGNGQIVEVTALDEDDNILDTVMITTALGSGVVWGGFTWGSANWGAGVTAAFRQYRIGWHLPIVFKQATIRMTGLAQSSTAFQNTYLRYQKVGYSLPGNY